MTQHLCKCRVQHAILLPMVFIAGSVFAVAAAVAQSISPAEKLLFQTNHMQGIHEPLSLTYSYRKESAADAGFDDQVHVDVTRINPDKSVAVSVRFLSGDRKLPIPDLDEAQGNPVLLGFLERDIAEMKRLTGGSTNYFRKRIRLALAESRQLRPVRFNYAGKSRSGQEVRIQPYLNDPLRDRMPNYVNKSYVFVISNQVPGSLYQARTSSSAAADNSATPADKPAMAETLTLVKHARLDAASAKEGKR